MGKKGDKEYYYYRNGLLHVKHVVDECVELSASERKDLLERLAEMPYDKQAVLEDEWSFQVLCLKKKCHRDGIGKARENFHRMSDVYRKEGRNG